MPDGEPTPVNAVNAWAHDDGRLVVALRDRPELWRWYSLTEEDAEQLATQLVLLVRKQRGAGEVASR